jgi:hypothetical protein
MKFNWGTVALIVALIVIIIGGVLLNSNQQTASVPTAQPTEAVVRLFEGLEGTRGVSLLIRDNRTDVSTVLTRDPSFQWEVESASGATVSTENRTVDQLTVPSLINSFAGLSSTSSFAPEAALESFGLATPIYTIELRTDDGGIYVMHVGEQNVAGNRYFVTLETTPGSGAAAPTAAPTEVVPTLDPSVTVTATTEPTAAPTTEPTATSTPRPVDAPTVTPVPSSTPVISLTDVATIYVVPTSPIDTLIALIGAPPYLPLPPTATPPPPTPNPFSEVEQTATAEAEMQNLIDMLTATADAAIVVTATPEATGDAAMSTPEATPAAATAAATATSVPATATPRASATPAATATP